MRICVRPDYETVSKYAAGIVSSLVRRKPTCVLGLATGRSPLGLYKELIRLYRNEGLDFSRVTTFNLDEYLGLPPEHEQSYAYFMYKNLFDHINVDARYVYIPHGMTQAIETYCEWYENEIKQAGGIDLQVLGIGVNGHIAFNEPCSSLGSRMRIKTLTADTRRENARYFKSVEDVPKCVLTVGVGTIMEARAILLVACGEAKAEAVRAMIEGPITSLVPASIVQLHRNATILLDEDAASLLSKVPLIERD